MLRRKGRVESTVPGAETQERQRQLGEDELAVAGNLGGDDAGSVTPIIFTGRGCVGRHGVIEGCGRRILQWIVEDVEALSASVSSSLRSAWSRVGARRWMPGVRTGPPPCDRPTCALAINVLSYTYPGPPCRIGVYPT